MALRKPAKPRRVKLTDGFHETVSLAINERISQMLPCTICGTCNWQFGNFVAAPVAIIPHRFNAFPRNTLAFVTVFCGNCGNTHFLNLRVLGFNPSEWEEPIAEESESSGEGGADGSDLS